MSDTANSDQQRQYVAEFSGGPLDGTVEHRFLVHGEAENRITQVALMEGTEGLYDYTAGSRREMNGMSYVTYTFDAADSDTLRGQADADSESKHL